MYYFDCSATTVPHDEVLEVFCKVSTHYWANPSSAHAFGEQARQLLNQARQQVAQLLQVSTKEVLMTSSGTESNQWVMTAIVDALHERHPHKRRIILSEVEHPSVMNHVTDLRQRGYDVQLCAVDSDGRLDLANLESLLNDDVLLLSTMAVNNEVGTIQPLEEMASLLQLYPSVAWHVDGVQAVTTQFSLLLNPRIDLLTLSSHKFHSVKGVGLLVKKQRIPSHVWLVGGGQEQGLRSSTENVPAIVATAKALRLAVEKQSQHSTLALYRQRLVTTLNQCGWTVFGGDKTSEHIVCAALPPIPGEVLVHAFGEKKVYVSTTSACSSRKHQSHHTLKAMGVSNKLSESAIRMSMSMYTTEQDIQHLIHAIQQVTHQLQ